MMSGSSAPGNRVVLVASFGSLHEAEAAARFLTDRGVPTRAIGLSGAEPDSPSSPGSNRRLARPVIFAVFGGVLTGVAGNALWSTVGPDVLTTGWGLIATVLVGATAAGSIGVAVDSGLEVSSQDDRVGQGAVVAVAESQIDDATGLLRRIGVDRTLV